VLVVVEGDSETLICNGQILVGGCVQKIYSNSSSEIEKERIKEYEVENDKMQTAIYPRAWEANTK
jgi:hypothetical protein